MILEIKLGENHHLKFKIISLVSKPMCLFKFYWLLLFIILQHLPFLINPLSNNITHTRNNSSQHTNPEAGGHCERHDIRRHFRPDQPDTARHNEHLRVQITSHHHQSLRADKPANSSCLISERVTVLFIFFFNGTVRLILRMPVQARSRVATEW